MQPPRGPYTSEALDGDMQCSAQCHPDPATSPYVDCCSKTVAEGRPQCWDCDDGSEQGSLHVVPCKVTCSQLVPGPRAETADRSYIQSMPGMRHRAGGKPPEAAREHNGGSSQLCSLDFHCWVTI